MLDRIVDATKRQAVLEANELATARVSSLTKLTSASGLFQTWVGSYSQKTGAHLQTGRGPRRHGR